MSNATAIPAITQHTTFSELVRLLDAHGLVLLDACALLDGAHETVRDPLRARFTATICDKVDASKTWHSVSVEAHNAVNAALALWARDTIAFHDMWLEKRLTEIKRLPRANHEEILDGEKQLALDVLERLYHLACQDTPLTIDHMRLVERALSELR